MPLKAIVFDIYSTLFHNETSYWMDTFRDICRIQGLPIPPEEFWGSWRSIEVRFRQARTSLEHPDKSPPFRTYQSAWIEAFATTFDTLGIRGDPDQAAQMSVEALASREPYEDTFPFLEYVGLRWKKAVLSNADNASIVPLLLRHRLPFDAVLTSEMARAYKPDPRVFHSVLGEMGVLPEEALYVGDTLLDDIHGAKLAGMVAVWLNRNGGDRDPWLLPPDYEVRGLNELMNLLESWKEVGPR
ncbi:MAG: HAD-superfamily hydrolase, subfamily variant 3 [Dehalococcoidia bacterium]|nr:HAD-superfamily hydrolase, subfamily variant 3 [Dehalococcoidia bacterium]